MADFINDVCDKWTDLSSSKLDLPSLPPPKPQLPGHELSYNPSPEFFDHDIPKITSLRQLENPKTMVQDQFERLLQLYLAPRVQKQRVQMTKE